MGLDDTGKNSLKSIYISNAGRGYTSQPQVTISDPESLTGIGGTYFFNEIVIGERSRTEGRVKSWDADTLVLKVSNVSIGTTQKGFFSGENIVGKDSVQHILHKDMPMMIHTINILRMMNLKSRQITS